MSSIDQKRFRGISLDTVRNILSEVFGIFLTVFLVGATLANNRTKIHSHEVIKCQQHLEQIWWNKKKFRASFYHNG